MLFSERMLCNHEIIEKILEKLGLGSDQITLAIKGDYTETTHLNEF